MLTDEDETNIFLRGSMSSLENYMIDFETAGGLVSADRAIFIKTLITKNILKDMGYTIALAIKSRAVNHQKHPYQSFKQNHSMQLVKSTYRICGTLLTTY